MNKWILTDSDSHQHVRRIDDKTFELIEMNSLLRRDFYEVYTDTICILDYPQDEMTMILGFFGYFSPAQVLVEYGKAQNQIIAECLFEHYGSFAVEPLATGLTWDEARAFIDQYISKERSHANEDDTLHLP